ncbi:MAG: dihydrolipoamide acetyltransferase family protein [Anderseniella sp.]
MTTFRLPDLGEGLREAEIVTWQVSEGDHIVADQPLVSVETEKAVVEIPSPQSGRVTKLHGQPGDIVLVGHPLVEYDGGDKQQSETVVGELPHGETQPVVSAQAPVEGRPKAAPAVRKLARDQGLDLAGIMGSGVDGTITLEDVRRAASTGDGDVAGERLRGPRRAMALAMQNAGAEIVPATLTSSADVTGWSGADDVTVRLISAVVAGCKAEPALNAWFHSASLTISRHNEVHVGVAMDTDEGLFVPVVRNADGLSATELRKTVNMLKGQVANRNIAREHLTGHTITLSNFGTLAGQYASLVVMPPQVAILGAGKISEQIVPVEGKPAVRRILPLSLTFDHRAVTGGEAARFMKAVIDSLENSDGGTI